MNKTQANKAFRMVRDGQTIGAAASYLGVKYPQAQRIVKNEWRRIDEVQFKENGGRIDRLRETQTK